VPFGAVIKPTAQLKPWHVVRAEYREHTPASTDSILYAYTDLVDRISKHGFLFSMRDALEAVWRAVREEQWEHASDLIAAQHRSLDTVTQQE